MAALTLEKEATVAVPQATLFKVFALENEKYLPKVTPQISVEVVEGNGGPGTIKKTTFGGEGSEFKSIKSKIEAIDKNNFTYSYSVIESEPPTDKLEKVTIEIKIEASADGGSIVKNTGKYYPKGNSQLDEDKIKAGAEKALVLFKAVEAYYLANPNAFNQNYS